MHKFVLLKFAALGLNSLRSLLLASFLGPANYGVLGVLVLIQQYLSYAALGMREGIAVSLSNPLHSSNDVSRICSSALTWGLGIGFFVAVCIAFLFSIGLLGPYLLLVAIIAFLSILNEILININRAEDKLIKVALLELLYNLIPMMALIYYWRNITISEVLSSLASGLFLSMSIYLWTLPSVRVYLASWATIKQLLGIGLPLSIQSLLMFAVNSVFIIIAKLLNQQAELGIMLLAANICTLIMFALNSIAWASTNRSMRLGYSVKVKREEYLRADIVRHSFRIGIVGAVIAAISTKLVFWWVLTSYSGADEFILYFVLFQAYGLLIFDELNYLAVKGRYRLVISAYSTLLFIMIVTAYALPMLAFAYIIKIGIAYHFMFALAVTVHSDLFSVTQGVRVRSKYVFLLFPISCMLLYSAAGHLGVVLICALAAPFTLSSLFLTRTKHA